VTILQWQSHFTCKEFLAGLTRRSLRRFGNLWLSMHPPTPAMRFAVAGNRRFDFQGDSKTPPPGTRHLTGALTEKEALFLKVLAAASSPADIVSPRGICFEKVWGMTCFFFRTRNRR